VVRKLCRGRRGEGYVDICVGVVAFVMILVISINIFSFITLRIEMDRIADEILDVSAFCGCFGEETEAARERLAEEYYDFTLETDADEYFNTAYHRVQLGHVMTVTVTVTTEIKGLGISIPITLSVTRSALSEKYWK